MIPTWFYLITVLFLVYIFALEFLVKKRLKKRKIKRLEAEERLSEH
jgi:hypothetical protein